MEAAAASVMDFHALSRRELQALCKRNGVRANMTNAAMADALQGLTSVDGVDEIGTTLRLPTPGRSSMKSAAVAGEEEQQQQHGSPLPRGRRVSVVSPAAIRMDVEEGDEEPKRGMVKEIVRTPGVALRTTSRRARATPAPLPTPATQRRSTRTTARKAAAPVEAQNLAEEESTVKRTTGRASARSKMMVDLDQAGEVAAATPKVQHEEPKAVASDVKCDVPEEEEGEEEEVTKLLEGDNKEEEPEEGEEADSSDAVNGSALVSYKSCDVKVEEAATVVEQETSKPQEGTVEEQEDTSAENSAPLEPMEDSPIFGVLSKSEATESVEDDEGVAEWSPANEMTDEINPAVEDKAGGVSEEVVKDVSFTVPGETIHFAKETLPSAETSEEDITSEEEGEAELTEDGTSEEDVLDEDEEWSSNDDETSEKIDSSDESDEENVKNELVQMMQDTTIGQEASEDSAEEASENDSAEQEATEDDSAEEDDFTNDLPPEFGNIVVLSDAETESDDTQPDLEENHVAATSATKTTVKSLDDSAISLTNEEGVSEEAIKKDANTVDTILKSMDEFTIKEGTHQDEENIGSEAVEPKGVQVEDYKAMSLRKLKATLKDRLAATAKQGKKHTEAKRLPLEEVDGNVRSDC